MPPVIDTPHDDHVEAHTLESAQPQARGARRGFWRSLGHGSTTFLPPTARGRHVPTCRTGRPFETPMDRLVQEYPSLSILVLAII